MVLHFTGDYDERYEAGDHLRNLESVLKRVLKELGNTFKTYRVPDKKLRKYNTTKKDATKGKFLRPDDKWLIPEYSFEVFKYDLVDSEHRPTMDIINDYSEQRMGTENRDDGAEDDDDAAAGQELFHVPDVPPEEKKADGEDGDFFGTGAAGAEDSPGHEGSGLSGVSAEVSAERSAEIQRLRDEMKQAKEESKEEAMNAENFKVIKEELTRRRTLSRRQTEIFREEKHDELWTPNELTPVQEEVEITQDFNPTSF